MARQSYEERLKVKKSLHGKIIGRSAATLKDIESDYGVTLTVPKRNDDSEFVVVRGSSQQSVTNAIRRIKDIAGIVDDDPLAQKAEKLRAKVDELRERKDKAFKEAKACRDKGRRSSLYDKANGLRDEYDRAMDAHQRAVFASKNAGYGDDQMDLHGLGLKTALDVVQERLDKVSPLFGNDDFTLTIITGIGNHSANRKAVIKPAVEKLLSEGGYGYELDPAGGQFVVDSADGRGRRPTSSKPTEGTKRRMGGTIAYYLFKGLVALVQCIFVPAQPKEAGDDARAAEADDAAHVVET